MFSGVLPRQYSGLGLTVTLVWAATTPPSGDPPTDRARWSVAVERLEPAGTSLDSDSFAAAESVEATPPTGSGKLQNTQLVLADGAAMDNLVAGEPFRLKVTREADDPGDTMSGDAELRFVVLRET